MASASEEYSEAELTVAVFQPRDNEVVILSRYWTNQSSYWGDIGMVGMSATRRFD